MKTTKKLILLIFSIAIAFSCSKNEDDLQTEKNSELVKYISTPNSNNQLISLTFLVEEDASTFIYGNTDSNGELSKVTSLAYKKTNSNTVYFIILDELLRVKEIYSETNNIKDAEVQSFTYPEDGLINFIVKERNWSSGTDKIKHFSVAELDGANYNSTTLFGKTSSLKTVEWEVLKSWIGVAISVAAAAITIYIAPTLLAGVLAGIIFTSAAFADVPPISDLNPNAPKPPIIVENICTNSSLKVFKVGVDPGNVLTAFVNGGVGSYKFYWSTGAKGTGAASHTITAPNSERHYVLVVDDNGCIAFGYNLSKNKWDLALFATNIDPKLPDNYLLTIEVDLNKSTANNPWTESVTFKGGSITYTVNFVFNYNLVTNILSCNTHLFEISDPVDAYRDDSFSLELSNDYLSFNFTRNKIGPELSPDISLKGTLQKK
ncbi:hypothetical protein [Mariniflexile sp.]|uniref:hypothetical protein n=1 Tax=Mariniflexile sp. TaxID=1979402 RepID=UPI0040478D4B